jgi:hypothetical protein
MFSNSLTWDGQIAGVIQCQEFREFRSHKIKDDKSKNESVSLEKNELCWSFSGADYMEGTKISIPTRIMIQIDVSRPFPAAVQTFSLGG